MFKRDLLYQSAETPDSNVCAQNQDQAYSHTHTGMHYAALDIAEQHHTAGNSTCTWTEQRGGNSTQCHRLWLGNEQGDMLSKTATHHPVLGKAPITENRDGAPDINERSCYDQHLCAKWERSIQL